MIKSRMKTDKICKYCNSIILVPYKRICCNSKECLIKQQEEDKLRFRKRNPISTNKSRKKYKLTHAIQIKVRQRTRNKNNKKGICEECNANDKVTTFHHTSYEPNIFKELCVDCHGKKHKKSKIGVFIVRKTRKASK